MSERYAYTPNPKRSAHAYGRGLRISTKSSVTICKQLRGMQLKKGKALLEGLVTQTRDLNGKYYTNTSLHILDMLKSCEANAEAKGLETDKLIIHATAHKGFTFRRPRSFKRARQKRKVTNLQMVLEVR
ncbi:MAG: hypothetical protein KKA90_01540 [Nanoarchaeota archaeon]|nr:hypothetical protein [Nanoarchaeota archaeon]